MAQIGLEFDSAVATRVPSEFVESVRATLAEIAGFDCRQLNPRLPEGFQVLSVKAGWVWDRWAVMESSEPCKTWWPEYFWLHLGVPDVVDLGLRHRFVNLQEAEPKPMQLPVRVDLALHYRWWIRYLDEVPDEANGEAKSYEHTPYGYDFKGGWQPGSSYLHALRLLTEKRIGEAHEIILGSYQEVEERLGFASLALEKLIDKLKEPQTTAA